MSRLSRAFVTIRTVWILDRTRVRPEITISLGLHEGMGRSDAPSCFDISLTPCAVSASCLVRLPVSSSSSMKSPSNKALPPIILDLSDSYPLVDGVRLMGEVTLDEPAELISGNG